MSRKKLSCSFVNKIYDNYNRVSYLQNNKNIAKQMKNVAKLSILDVCTGPGYASDTAQKMKFSIKDFFSKCD